MLLARFLTDRRASIAPMFALAIIPVIGMVGMAVDYSRANSVKAAMQAALDSTALMLSKEASTMTQSQMSQKANDYFKAMFNRPEAQGVTVTPTLSTPAAGSFALKLDGSATVDTTFSRIFGQQQLVVGSSSEVKWGMKRLELALALDNTGSMAWSGKMNALKTSTKNLLTTLKNAAKKPDDVKVAIIPFDTTVNLGTAYKDQPWFDIDSIDCNGWAAGTGCNSTNWKQYWEGCVRDRKYPYDGQDTTPTNSSNTKFPVYDCGTLTNLLPLTNDWTALNAKVDQMNPNGYTNVTIGLVWAWHALTQGTPLTEAAAPAPDLDKVIILLTDGDNTRAWNNASNNEVTSQSAIDARTKLVCANVKAAGIKLYVVRVIEGNATLLKECASNPTMYFDVQQASQLNAVFTTIAQNLANLRLSK